MKIVCKYLSEILHWFGTNSFGYGHKSDDWKKSLYFSVSCYSTIFYLTIVSYQVLALIFCYLIYGHLPIFEMHKHFISLLEPKPKAQPHVRVVGGGNM